MNILPKKKWHVRTKENVARVRRDQKLAAEEEKRIAERAQLAEQEYKVNLLRRNAEERMERVFGVKKSEGDNAEHVQPTAGTSSGHVNFFVDLEAEDRKNLGTGNREYELEKRQEKEEYEKKLGILQYLGQGSKELTKEVPWYEQIKRDRPATTHAKKVDGSKAKEPNIAKETEKVKRSRKRRKSSDSCDRDHRKRSSKHHSKSKDKKKKKKRRHERSSSSDASNTEANRTEVNAKLEQLRAERMQREAAERRRVENLLNPKREVDTAQKKSPKYHSQFNPLLARQNRA